MGVILQPRPRTCTMRRMLLGSVTVRCPTGSPLLNDTQQVLGLARSQVQ